MVGITSGSQEKVAAIEFIPINENDDDRSDSGTAPPQRRPSKPNIERAEQLAFLENDEFDPSRPTAFEACLEGEIDSDATSWATNAAWRFARTDIEGAAFARIAEDVFLIPVRGAQPLHHDRHLGSVAEDVGVSEHTWNLVVSGTESQMLISEVGHDVFEHFPMSPGVLVYMNTVLRHMVTRRDPTDLCTIVQVCGYGPDERDGAVARIAEVLAARPSAVRL